MSRRLRIKDSGLFPEARPAKPFRRAFRFLPAPVCLCLPLSASARVSAPARVTALLSVFLPAFLPVSPACVLPVSACVSVLCYLHPCLLFLPAFTCVPVGIPFRLLPGFSQHSCGRRPVFGFFRRPLCRPAAVRCDFPPQRSADAPPGLSAGAVCAVRCLEAVVAGECPAEPISRCACFFTGLNFQISFSFRTFARL